MGHIEYAGRKIVLDIANLGYYLTDVTYCLSHLSENDYRNSHTYGEKICDAYCFEYKRMIDGEETTDSLYIKFSLTGGTLSIELASFHLTQ
jgi:hypothetical protein